MLWRIDFMVLIFKKRPIEEIKQPQEYYCSNEFCINEVAQFSKLSNLLTDEAYNMYADLYCIDCLIDKCNSIKNKDDNGNII
jgi:hypothetical protein